MSGKQIDLFKKSEGMNPVEALIASTIYHPVMEKIYKKNSAIAFLGEFSMFLEKPTLEGIEAIKLSSALIYWDIIFVLLDNKLKIYADDFEKLSSITEEDIFEMSNMERNVYFLNSIASRFYSFANIGYEVNSPKSKSISMMFLI